MWIEPYLGKRFMIWKHAEEIKSRVAAASPIAIFQQI